MVEDLNAGEPEIGREGEIENVEGCWPENAVSSIRGIGRTNDGRTKFP